MTFVPHTPDWRAGLVVPAILMTVTVLAQAPDVKGPQSDGSRLRQPTAPSVQEDLQASADKNQADADRRFREMDRRLNRTMRSVCVRC
jgi:hypothetical protein